MSKSAVIAAAVSICLLIAAPALAAEKKKTEKDNTPKEVSLVGVVKMLKVGDSEKAVFVSVPLKSSEKSQTYAIAESEQSTALIEAANKDKEAKFSVKGTLGEKMSLIVTSFEKYDPYVREVDLVGVVNAHKEGDITKHYLVTIPARSIESKAVYLIADDEQGKALIAAASEEKNPSTRFNIKGRVDIRTKVLTVGSFEKVQDKTEKKSEKKAAK